MQSEDHGAERERAAKSDGDRRKAAAMIEDTTEREIKEMDERPQQQTTRGVSTCGAVDRRLNVGVEESGGGEPLMPENPSC
ncbi:hypothetical protein PIB30_011230 [Stylosanthes scabra]|uniref:Uncharacterized protein n=1 Tax=Stylosanthes scabra TaxID=79078 RepID=A0ABU6T5L8_9FABA|nr:hypothetical protein [Stylosanthes scabra]